MKFMVEFRLQPGSKSKVMDVFELHGPNRNPGVKFRGAWIGTSSELAYVLVEAADEALVRKAAQSWEQYGSYQLHPVIDVEQY